MQKILKAWIKKIFSDLHSIILTAIVLSFLGTGGASLVSEKTWHLVKKAILLPLPLWLTIALVLATYTYFHIKKLRSYSFRHKTKYFTIGNFKWETKIYSNTCFEVENTPLCAKHDLRLLFSGSSRYCPEADKRNCKNQISDYDHYKIYSTAKSYIDKQIRNKN